MVNECTIVDPVLLLLFAGNAIEVVQQGILSPQQLCCHMGVH